MPLRSPAPPRRRVTPPPLAWYGVGWAAEPAVPDPEPTPAPTAPAANKESNPTPAVDPSAFGPCEAPRQGGGVVLGRFLPPHAGHLFLLDFARAYCQHLSIFMRCSPDDVIPAAVRLEWLEELLPKCRVLGARDEGPAAPSVAENPKIAQSWADFVKSSAGRPDYLFSSEPHDAAFAQLLGCRFVPVDPRREAVPVSGRQIREDLSRSWVFLPPCVRAFLARRVCILGPESTGKTTLARALAAHYQTLAVPEAARVLSESAEAGSAKTGSGKADLLPADVQAVVRGQLAAEIALARQANRVLFCDTGPLQVMLWSKRMFGHCPTLVSGLADHQRCDLYLLTDADLPFRGDAARNRPAERAAFLAQCEAELTARKLPYIKVTGTDPQERIRIARDAVDRLLADSNRITAEDAKARPAWRL